MTCYGDAIDDINFDIKSRLEEDISKEFVNGDASKYEVLYLESLFRHTD